jgi:Zn finger protein HypA/HybF involved in hydrogenase expression
MVTHYRLRAEGLALGAETEQESAACLSCGEMYVASRNKHLCPKCELTYEAQETGPHSVIISVKR